jgi:TRAP transporter 4TM/12TM fusion protein
VGLVGVFIFYALYSNIFPGFIHGRGYSWARLTQVLYFYSDGIFGVAFYVIATICLVYILFGQMLFQAGGGKFLTDFSLSLMGRFRGGPAKVAVLASSLFGTISGSAVANVLTTGVITIPMMKSMGYRSHFAGAVEAAASTGGQIMPPIMGSVAFMIAEFLGISYGEVVIAAVIPALLYYIAVYIQVDLEAAKLGLKGLSPDKLPHMRQSLKLGWQFAIPLIILVLCLIWLKLRAKTAGLYGITALFIVSLAAKQSRLNLAKLRLIFAETGQGLLEISVLGAMAGIIIGSVTLTGLGVNLSQGLIDVSRGNLLVLLLLAALASTMMGMGLPVITCYILLAILVAPALVKMGVMPLSAHLFIFYYGTFSFLTPPVCPAAYVAAVLAHANAMSVALRAVRLAVVAYIVPFIFVLNPLLLMSGSPLIIIGAFITATLGTIILGIALEGYLWRTLGWFTRLVLGGAGLALIVPEWRTNLTGAFIAILLLLRERRTSRALRPVSSQQAG